MAINVKVINKSGFDLPEYKTRGASGMDLKSTVDLEIKPFERVLVPTGLYIELPWNFEVQIRTRSGKALDEGLIVLNSPGTVDEDYRGEIGVILMNVSRKPVTIKKGDCIAQAVLTKISKIRFIETDKLSDTQRGEGGFGSTDRKEKED